MRLQRYLARCGLGSRRSCESLIDEGRVTVNGEAVVEQGFKVNEGDEVKVDGRPVQVQGSKYFILNKPKGAICVDKDELGRRYVVELIPGAREAGCFPVGRLDVDTTGLLIITNDGELANRIAHPRYEVQKIYRALVHGMTDDARIKGMERGVRLETGRLVTGIKVLRIKEKGPDKEVVLAIHEGRRHVVKRLFLSIGSRVKELERTAIGGLTLPGLPPGGWERTSASSLIERIGL